MYKKAVALLLALLILPYSLCACGGSNTTATSQSVPNNIVSPADLTFEPLYAQRSFTAGKLVGETGIIEQSDSYGYIVNYPVKKGRVLSISDQKFKFSIMKYENGSYSNVIKEPSIKSYTVTEDMNIAISITKADGSPIPAQELSNVSIRDTLFRMTDVVGNIHRFTVEAQTIDGGTHTTRAALFMPVSYSENGTPNKLILITNGHKGYLSDSSWYSNSEENTKLIQNYLTEGYAVFVVDNTSGAEGKASDMGCAQLVSSYFKAYEYIQENFNVEQQVYLHSRSFGTFAAIRIMRERPELIKCALMTGPRVSMQKEWDENRPDKDHVANRFGFTDTSGNTYEADKLVGHDPYTDIKSGDYTLPPTFWMLANGDMTERPEEFIAELTKLGNQVKSKTYSGLNHNGICALATKQATADALEYLSQY